MLFGKVRVLSDLHLGHPGSLIGDVGQLRPLLEGIDTVVFNGDTCELTYAGWRERGAWWLDSLNSLCDELGVRPLFLTGNHDPDVSDQGWLVLMDGALFVTHGDLVSREVAPWSREYLARKRVVAAVWADREGLEDDLRNRWEGTQAVEEILRVRMPPKLKLRGRLQLLSALWPPERALAILRAWATMFPAARGFMRCYRPGAQAMVFGHFHRPGVSRRDGCLLVNTGAFMNGSSVLVVDVEGDAMAVRCVRKNSEGAFLPGDPVSTHRITRQAT